MWLESLCVLGSSSAPPSSISFRHLKEPMEINALIHFDVVNGSRKSGSSQEQGKEDHARQGMVAVIHTTFPEVFIPFHKFK